MERTLHQRRLQQAGFWQSNSMGDVLQAVVVYWQLVRPAAEAYRPCQVPQDCQEPPRPLADYSRSMLA